MKLQRETGHRGIGLQALIAWSNLIANWPIMANYVMLADVPSFINDAGSYTRSFCDQAEVVTNDKVIFKLIN